MNNIAANIRALRREKGLSQDELARRLHVTRQTVSAWERGASRPSLDALGEIARALGVPEERLLYGGQERKPRLRAVSYAPALWIVPLYLLMVLVFIPVLLIPIVRSADATLYTMAGQIFLAVVILFCYCSLKDEIRNREYYDRRESAEDGEE